MICPHCKQPLRVKERHENIIVWHCVNPDCIGFETEEDTGEEPHCCDRLEDYLEPL